METSLPVGLHQKLVHLSRRIRLLRIVQALSSTLLVVAALLAAFFLADFFVGLEPAGFRIAFTTVVGFGLIYGLTLIARAARPVSLQALATLIERQHPELDERLLSSVQLTQKVSPAHGSPALIAALIQQSDQASQPINFADAYSSRPTRKWATAGMVAVAVCLLALLTPAWADFQRNLWSAWNLPRHGFELQLTGVPSHAVRGRPLQFSAAYQPLWDRAAVPGRCTLVIDDGTHSRRVPMNSSENSSEAARFVADLDDVQDDFQVHVEANGIVSDPVRVQVVAPLAFAAGGPRADVSPPAYAVNQPATTHDGQTRFDVLEHSGLTWKFQFDRPFTEAILEIEDTNGKSSTFNATSASGDSGLVAVPTRTGQIASAALVVTDEHGLHYRFRLPTWNVYRDHPPAFSEQPFAGALNSSAHKLAPDDPVLLKVAVEDTVGLGNVQLEYQVDEGKVEVVTIAEGANQTQVHRDFLLPIAGKIKAGQKLKLRLLVSDNRRMARGQAWDKAGLVLPATDLTPQVTYHPATAGNEPRWHIFDIETEAEPLALQDASKQRDKMHEKIVDIIAGLEEERRELTRTKFAAHHLQVLDAGKLAKINEVMQANTVNQNKLRKLAWEMAADPNYQMLANQPLAVADNELKRGDKALEESKEKYIGPEKRDLKFMQADREIAKAIDKLFELKKANQDLAQDRLDQVRMESIARRQQLLAEKAAELAKMDLSNNPEAKAELDRLREEQARLEAELNALAQRSELFQQAMKQAQIDQAKQLAQDAQKLAHSQRDMFDQSKKEFARQGPDLLGDLAARQGKLAEGSAELGKNVKLPLLQAPKFAEAASAAKALERADVEKALADQKQTIRDLQKLERDLGKSTLLGSSLKDAANNLAQYQDKLRKKLYELGEDFSRLTQQQRLDRLKDIKDGQAKIHDMLKRLKVPDTLAKARELHEAAVKEADAVMKAFANAYRAFEQMPKLRSALEQLAQVLPDDAASKVPDASAEEKRVQEQANQARAFAKEQQQIHDEVLKLLAKAGADGDKGEGPLGSMAKTQKELEQKVDSLKQDFMKLSQNPSPQAKMAAGEAEKAVEQAKEAMTQAKKEMAEGKTSKAEKLAEDAAMKLEIAGMKAEQAAKELMASQPKEMDASQKEASQALTQAKQQMTQAQKQLSQGQPKSAQPSMQQAAKSLRQTAQAMARQSKSAKGQPGKMSASSSSAPEGPLSPSSPIALKLMEMGGKTWGELPGELRTRLVQDMRARYGPDYARMIHRYFEQVADTKK